MNRIEITAPVGTWESLMAAIHAGTDSVYFGVGILNMRARSSVNFTLRDLAKIARICREHSVKTYLTLNTVIYDRELSQVRRIIDSAKKNGINAIIASDHAVISYARSAGMPVHMSTQTNITNLEAVKYWSGWADVMVLARELSLGQVASISRAIKKQKINGPSGDPVRIEVFAHGALCMAVSGKCYLSLDHYNASANRGACYQLCRRPYHVVDEETGTELDIDNEYIMSPKDLFTIGFLDKIVKSGVSVLKIEGRGRSPEYVRVVVECYREAIDAIRSGRYTKEKIAEWIGRLSSVYNRGFWDGYYLGQKMGEWARRHGSEATESKEYVGRVNNYFSKPGVAEIRMDSGFLAPGDRIWIQGPTTGVIAHTITELRTDAGPVEKAVKGELCAFAIGTFLRRADKIYKIISHAV